MPSTTPKRPTVVTVVEVEKGSYEVLSPSLLTTPPPSQPIPNITIQHLPTRNSSLITTTALARGTLITAEPPLLTFHNTASQTSEERYAALSSSLASLSPLEHQIFFGLFNAFAPLSQRGGGDSEGSEEEEELISKAFRILKTNCLPLSEDVNPFRRSSSFLSPPLSSSAEQEEKKQSTMNHLGVFQTISRANHSCIPNAEFSWCEAEGEGRLFAVCDIAAGEEVVIDYAGGQPFAQRREFLREGFKFECVCGGCGLEDEKVLQLQEFERLEGEIVQLQGDASSMVLIRDALELLEDIGIQDMRLAKMHGYALRTATNQGDLKGQRVFAQLYYEACVACLGENHVESESAEEEYFDLLDAFLKDNVEVQ